MSAKRQRLTADNTNARGHRLVGDTLVFECPDCESQFELFVRPAEE